MTSAATTGTRQRTAGVALRVLGSEYLVLFLCLTWFVCVLPFAPGFTSPENLTNILASLLPLLVVATGQTFVMVAGGIDLSVTSIIALSSVTGALLMNGDTGPLAGSALAVPGGILVMLAVGGAVGAFNGLAITRVNMPPFIVTLTTMMFFSGFAIWLTQSKTIYNLPPTFNAMGGRILFSSLVTLWIAVLAHLVLSRSLFGRWLYAIGHKASAAAVSGVPVLRVTLLVYVISGLCGAVASILYTGRLETGSPVTGQKILLDVIGATVIGGTSLYGGKGKVLWTFFGVLFLTLIDNSLNLLNLSHFAIMMVKGAVILLAALIDSLRSKGLAA
jgi:ribose transport system permease protein